MEDGLGRVDTPPVQRADISEGFPLRIPDSTKGAADL